ncbi:MAG: hypothetical protein ACOCZB_03550 [Spirochaetota bacterium]
MYACTYDHIGVILWGEKRLLRSVEKALDHLERYPGFSVGWDHEAYTYDWLSEHAPDLLERMRSAVAENRNRVGVGGSTYGQPLSAFVDGESNIRQLIEGVRTVRRRLGYRLSVYLTSEHGFHPQLPQLLVGCGFEAAVLRTHFMMYGHNREFDEPVIWWTGTDGSRISAIPTYIDQGTTPPLYPDKIPGPTSTLDNRIMTDSVSQQSPLDLNAFRERFGRRIMPLIATRADDDRSSETLLEAHRDDPNVHWTTLEQAVRLAGQPRSSHRLTADDMRARMPWGYCGNRIWSTCRAAEKRVQSVERLVALWRSGDANRASENLREAWKALLLAQHHDIQICGLEEDARAAIERCEDHLRRALEAIGLRWAAAAKSHDGARLVFNPLTWSRTCIALSPDPERRTQLDGLAFAPAEEAPRSSLPGSESPAADDAFSFARGAKHPVVVDNQYAPGEERMRRIAVPEGASRLDTRFYEIYFSDSGGIRLLLDRQTGRRVFGPPFSSGSLAATIDGISCYSEGRLDDPWIGRHATTIVETGTIGPIPYASTWTFYRDRRRIDWQGSFDFSPDVSIGRVRSDTVPPLNQEITRRHSELHAAWADHEYKLRLRLFPFVSPFATLHRDVPFAHEATAARYPQGLHWTAYGDGNAGVAVLNRGLMGSILESDGALSTVIAFSLPYTWGTRTLDGRYTYELGILPYVGETDTSLIQREAIDYNFPFLELVATPGTEPSVHEYSDHCSSNVVLSAMYRSNGRTYLRFAETEGREGRVNAEWNGRPVNLRTVDFLERELAEIGSNYRMAPWQVQTFELMENAE